MIRRAIGAAFDALVMAFVVLSALQVLAWYGRRERERRIRAAMAEAWRA